MQYGYVGNNGANSASTIASDPSAAPSTSSSDEDEDEDEDEEAGLLEVLRLLLLVHPPKLFSAHPLFLNTFF